MTLAANAGGIEVRAPGRALADAGALQRVRVQNLNSLKVVEGIAESDGCGPGNSLSPPVNWLTLTESAPNKRRSRLKNFQDRPLRDVDDPGDDDDGEQNQRN